MAEINGKCDEKFARVSELLNYSLDSGDDIGASVAVFIEGEPIVDIWGGYFDGTFPRKWERDTIICNHSTTKRMPAIAALVLADRGNFTSGISLNIFFAVIDFIVRTIFVGLYFGTDCTKICTSSSSVPISKNSIS
jgi:hypothetical protein